LKTQTVAWTKGEGSTATQNSEKKANRIAYARKEQHENKGCAQTRRRQVACQGRTGGAEHKRHIRHQYCLKGRIYSTPGEEVGRTEGSLAGKEAGGNGAGPEGRVRNIRGEDTGMGTLAEESPGEKIY
jgi:hypothetical protein